MPGRIDFQSRYSPDIFGFVSSSWAIQLLTRQFAVLRQISATAIRLLEQSASEWTFHSQKKVKGENSTHKNFKILFYKKLVVHVN